MKSSQFYITLALAAVSLVLSLVVILQGESSISAQKAFQERQTAIQTEVQQKQTEVNEGTTGNQITVNMVKDIAAAAYNQTTGAVKNEKLKELLTRYGINVTVTPQPSPAK
jgi:G:T/U-mismatch repair DNA glycosylase